MTAAELFPCLHGIQRFRYTEGGAYRSIDREKTQHTYRLLAITGGSLSLVLGGREQTASEGALIFLRPGDRYRFLPRAPFSLVGVFFSLAPPSAPPPPCACILTSDPRAEALPAPIPMSDAARMNAPTVFRAADAFRAITELAALPEGREFYELSARAALLTALAALCRGEVSPSAPAARALARLAAYTGGELSPASLASELGYHPSHLNRLLRAETGKTLGECIRSARIDYADALISEGSLSGVALAFELGYYDYSHFYKAYLAERGRPPALRSGI